MEAALAGKALITTTDAGGILGLVKHQETGWVADPSVDSLAETMSNVFDQPLRTAGFGDAARALWTSMNINWPATVERLLK